MRRWLTQNVHHGEAVVESHSHEEAAHAEGAEGAAEGRGDAADEAHEVGAHEGRDAAEAIGDPAEDQAAEDGAAEEDGGGGVGEGRVLADPVLLEMG